LVGDQVNDDEINDLEGGHGPDPIHLEEVEGAAAKENTDLVAGV